MKNNLKIVFFGTPEFSVPALQSLLAAGFNISAAVTRPDKPAGRQQTLAPPPVKIAALENNIEVLQPVKIDDALIEKIKSLHPDLFVIVAYGKILPPALLDIPPHGSVNIHPSLLPKYRGPSPLQATLLSDETETGVTIMRIDEEMDHGPVLKNYKLQKSNLNNFYYESLGKELFELGAKYLPEVIKDYIAGRIKPQPQDHDQATYCKMVKKEHGRIDWQLPAAYIEKMTRAYFPWPGAFGTIKTGKQGSKGASGLEIKIIKAGVSPEKTSLKPGIPFKTGNDELAIACGRGSILIIDELQPTGKKKMASADFLRGHAIF